MIYNKMSFVTGGAGEYGGGRATAAGGHGGGGHGGGGGACTLPHDDASGLEPPDVFCALCSLIVEGRIPGTRHEYN